ncbi:hypothetical protein [Ligilactobacillus murinus]|uniref:hypothetical protein n=1 Tax=Ligilactobacillus murinus TaxID=1622 RepID=UPI0012983D06|nr:hypothetical protein [Ligilactobacillus murinus]
MLHENNIENQVRAMRKDKNIMENQKLTFDQLKQQLADKIANDELTPQEARFYIGLYGERLEQSDPILLRRVARLAVSWDIIRFVRSKVKQNSFTTRDLKFILGYFGSDLKRYEPELYDHLKELEISFDLKMKG